MNENENRFPVCKTEKRQAEIPLSSGNIMHSNFTIGEQRKQYFFKTILPKGAVMLSGMDVYYLTGQIEIGNCDDEQP